MDSEIRKDEFQQRVLASSIGTVDPQLYFRLFEPTMLPSEVDETGFQQLTGVDEIAAMFDQWESEDRLGRLGG